MIAVGMRVVPPRGRQVVDEDHRGARVGDSLQRRQLGEFFRVAHTGARPIGEDLLEGKTESFGDRLGDLLTEAVRTARMAATSTAVSKP